MITALSMGIVFGLTAGLAPGPLLTLTIAHTLRFGKGAGAVVAMAPLITDVPIVAGTLLILYRVAELERALGILALFGALFVLYLAYETARATRPQIDEGPVVAGSIARGAFTNLLNPHPYLFWIMVGGPTTIRFSQSSPWFALLFVATFYVHLVGAKLLIVLALARFRGRLSDRVYVFLMRILAVGLVAFAWCFVADGLRLLGGASR